MRPFSPSRIKILELSFGTTRPTFLNTRSNTSSISSVLFSAAAVSRKASARARDRFSLADIAVGVTLYRYFEMDIDRPALSNLQGWYERLRERPAFRDHVMISFEELRG